MEFAVQVPPVGGLGPLRGFSPTGVALQPFGEALRYGEAVMKQGVSL